MSNQHSYRVPFTEEQLTTDYFKLRMSQKEIAVKYGTSQKVVWKAMRKMGMAARTAAKRDQFRENNPTWKGGRILVAVAKKKRGERTAFGNGYYYLLHPEHPNCDARGYVAEHIYVVTAQRGKPLARGEMVHHIDLNKHNNSPENLAVTTASEHSVWHAQLEEIAVQFMREGRIGFDAARGYFKK